MSQHKVFRHFALTIIVPFFVAFCISAHATQYGTPGIRGTDHDFANRFGCYDSATNSMILGCTPWTNADGSPEDEICIFCHTPHHANTAVPIPLWNRSLQTTNYTPYSSPTGTMHATVGQPTGISKVCLSCHDGTIAIDAYGANIPGAGHTMNDLTCGLGGGFGNDGPNLGTDLNTDHPISFTYDTALSVADPGVYNPAIAISHVGDTPANPNQPIGITVISVTNSGSTNTIEQDMLDVNSQVQCTSCHEPHNKYGWDKFLVKNNTGSALCLTCHNK